jgi:hypothetical protein
MSDFKTVDVDKVASVFCELRRRFPTTSSARNMRDAFWSVVGREPWEQVDATSGRCTDDAIQFQNLVMFLAFERAKAAK